MQQVASGATRLDEPGADAVLAAPAGHGYLSREGQETLRWALPAVAFFCGLFVEHVGLYLATRGYVRWMDELHRPFTGTEAFEGSEPSGDDWDFAVFFEVLMDFLPVISMGLVLRFGSLRLWCQSMLAAALVTTVKGFAVWGTIVPDKGWKLCEARLGLDGLRYYREDQPLSSMLQDILLLEVQALWLGSSRQRLCVVHAPFHSSICVVAIFCLAGCEVSQRWREAEMPARLQALRYVLLALLASALLLSKPETMGFTLMGIVLAFAVYGNPAVALAAEAWCRGTEAGASATDVLVTPMSSLQLSPHSSVALMGQRQPSEIGEDGAYDVGKVLVLPMVRYCYMQQYPLESSLLQRKALLRQLLLSLQQSKEQLQRKEQKKSELLKKEQQDELLGAVRADRFAEQSIQEALRDQQRMLNSRARRTHHQTVNFEDRHRGAQLLKNSIRSCKSSPDIKNM